MAETAAILAPDKTVLIPDLDAGCSLASSITADDLRAWKGQHPDEREILFLPDMFLGLWLEQVTGRRLRIWMGECHGHRCCRLVRQHDRRSKGGE